MTFYFDAFEDHTNIGTGNIFTFAKAQRWYVIER